LLTKTVFSDNWVSVTPKTDDKTKSALTELKSRIDNMTLELSRTEFYAEVNLVYLDQIFTRHISSFLAFYRSKILYVKLD